LGIGLVVVKNFVPCSQPRQQRCSQESDLWPEVLYNLGSGSWLADCTLCSHPLPTSANS